MLMYKLLNWTVNGEPLIAPLTVECRLQQIL